MPGFVRPAAGSVPGFSEGTSGSFNFGAAIFSCFCLLEFLIKKSGQRIFGSLQTGFSGDWSKPLVFAGLVFLIGFNSFFTPFIKFSLLATIF